MLVRDGVVVGHAGGARVDVGAAELLRGHLLAGGRLHERRAAEKDRARALDDHRLVAHRRDVGASGGAGAHDRRDLRNPRGRHHRLVEEDAPEVLAVRKDLVLHRQEGAAGIHQVDAREPVLPRDLLGAEVLLDGERVVRAALHRRVVRDDHALPPLDDADPGDHPCRGRVVVVEAVRRERVQLEERRLGVEEPVDTLAGEELPARTVLLDRLVASAARRLGRALAKLRDERLHALPVRAELRSGRVGSRLENRH